jgi:hypothetical protein
MVWTLIFHVLLFRVLIETRERERERERGRLLFVTREKRACNMCYEGNLII